MRRPLAFTVLTLAFLLLAGSPMLNLRLGNNGLDGLPDTLEGVKTLRLMSQKWPQGTTLSMVVTVNGVDRPEVKEALERFKTETLKVNGLSGPAQTTVSKGGKVARVSFVMSGSRNDALNQNTVRQVRAELIPLHFQKLGVTAYVGGGAASTLDIVAYYLKALPLVIGFVLTLSFILLLLVFHSLIIPIKAILLNLFSSVAAYGALVLVFQDGWFAKELDFRPTGVIESFAPLFMFTILFGLSMDYHLFILTRIKEARDKGMSSNEAVAKGISVTSGTITSAAAIMVVVFGVFVTLQIVIVKQLGLGLAVAVFVDATIIRSVLLPSTMRLLGEWNWWLPSFLAWLPQVTIEGEAESTRPKQAMLESEAHKV